MTALRTGMMRRIRIGLKVRTQRCGDSNLRLRMRDAVMTARTQRARSRSHRRQRNDEYDAPPGIICSPQHGP